MLHTLKKKTVCLLGVVKTVKISEEHALRMTFITADKGEYISL